jgi:competence protein ComEC
MQYLPYIIGIGLIGVVLVLWYNRKTNGLARVIIAISIFLGVGIYVAQSLNSNPYVTPSETIVTVTFIDVGQALSILIRDNLGNDILYDGGNNQDATFLINYFKELKIDDFEYVIASHFHEDHIGGLDNILAKFKVDTILMPNIPYSSDDYTNLTNAINAYHVVVQPLENDLLVNLGDISFRLIGPDTDFSDINAQSLVVQFSFLNQRILLTGDSTTTAEKLILTQDIQSDIIQIAHHGSKTSSSLAFLSATQAEYAIISVGINNSYGLPDTEVIKRIHDLDMTLYRTDSMGTIIFTITHDRVSVKAYPTIGNK